MKSCTRFVVWVVVALTLVSSMAQADTLKPNIIVIYTDDQGYGDSSYLNPESKIKTPSIDRLATEGIAFTHGHSSESVCTPSRYSLLTGRYSWRTHLKTGVMKAEATGLIPDNRMTLASMLRDNGYSTAMVGKWHLGMEFPGEFGQRDWSKPVEDMPLDKGFDYFYGIPASLNYGVLAWFDGRHAKIPPTQFGAKRDNERHVDYRIKPPYYQSVAELKTHTDRTPLEIAPDFIDNKALTRFTDKAIEWIDSKKQEAKDGSPFFVYLPYTSPHYPVAPLKEFWGKSEVGAYGDFMMETDYHVGRILDYLKEAGLDDNTMIVFTSDNGPENSWKERITEFGHDSSGIFKGGKRDIYEGGHRVPFFVRWPEGIDNPGRDWDKPVGQVDLLATFSELVNFPLPDDGGEDSQSFASLLTNAKADYERVPLVQSAYGRFSITEGDWKLIMPGDGIVNKEFPSRSIPATELELYNLKQDPAETNNVVKQHPKIVASLHNQLTEIVVSGRSTPGKPQANDTGYWPELTWMTEEEYEAAHEQVQ
ncbi:arylsulfatase [Gilvimarinus agarilyticus]|uniref:sulfatase family protein n=1 Tax=Gilvimarinus sp. 2_MG-2023 TaxID=3062666 RepID=UPI001C08EB77|nr:arylsulfatase [Gilvimarinus sp. 2_MG-2023]MBU2886173.1 arylsulfatase [Gilvimarinus agarilyticus]MDO6570876.1 arylsulfatase [Gilvimarinus sp. 2_MG-2023]